MKISVVRKISVVGWLLILAGFWTVMIFGGLAGIGRDLISIIAVVILGLGGMTASVFVLADLTRGRR